MFEGATSFNGNVAGFDTSQVRSFDSMFRGAKSFDRDVSEWDLSSCESLASAFYMADTFNGALPWNVSSCVDMSFTFAGAASFSGQGLTDWDTSRVRTMKALFQESESMSADLSGWTVSAVTEMSDMVSFRC